MTGLADDIEAASETEELRAALVRAQRALVKEKIRTAALVAAVHEGARDAFLAMGKPPPIPTPKPSRSKLAAHVALLHTTDWQCGKQTVDYSADVLERRLNQMIDKTATLTERHGHPVTEVVVLFGGDDIEGVTIFPSQPFEVHAGLYEQMAAVVRLKRMVVDRALALFPKVTVRRKWGNHGRIGKFGELPDTDNLDLMADLFASQHYETDKRVTWHSADMEYIQKFAIGNYKAALLHGNEFYRSFSAQRITQKVTAWQTQHEFGDVYMGHFHRSDVYGLPNGSRVYLTGSPESSNAYAADFLAAKGQPSQRLHFIDPEEGRVMSEHVLWLD